MNGCLGLGARLRISRRNQVLKRPSQRFRGHGEFRRALGAMWSRASKAARAALLKYAGDAVEVEVFVERAATAGSDRSPDEIRDPLLLDAAQWDDEDSTRYGDPAVRAEVRAFQGGKVTALYQSERSRPYA